LGRFLSRVPGKKFSQLETTVYVSKLEKRDVSQGTVTYQPSTPV